MRLDRALVTRGLIRSRIQVIRLVVEGRVRVVGVLTQKPVMNVDAPTEISTDIEKWVSRAAHRLLGAIADSGTSLHGRVSDAGASTGGFTQVALEHGSNLVYAVDVGHHQLTAPIRSDPRVRVREGLNLRDLSPADPSGEPADVVVGDVLFISLKLLLPSLLGAIRPGGMALLLVEPQSEVGKERLGADGVVRDSRLREEAVDAVVEAAGVLGWGCDWRSPSRFPGVGGNQEFFIRLCSVHGVYYPQ